MAAAGEVALTWSLVKTYSRGALAGLGAAGVVMLGLQAWQVWRGRLHRVGLRVERDVPARSEPSERAGDVPLHLRGLLLVGGLRVILLLFCLGVSGGFERVAPNYVNTDKSVLNRLDLWQGGLELVAVRPVQGWGWGNAGQSFMNWTQPVGRDEAYKSMVNSYLTVAVEGGLPVFGLLLFLGGLVVAAGVRLSMRVAHSENCGSGFVPDTSGLKPDSHGPVSKCVTTDKTLARSVTGLRLLALAATGSVIGWAGCIFFSNLWIFSGLWVAPGLSAVLLVSLALMRRKTREIFLSRTGARTALEVASGVGLLCGAMFVIGQHYAQQEAVILAVTDGAVVLIGKDARADDPGILVLPDSAVLGERPGQELRRWARADPSLKLIVPLEKPTPAQIKAAPQIVAFGAACGDPGLIGAKVVLIHPYEPPPDNLAVAPGSVLRLPGIDLARRNSAWREWAATQPGLEVKDDFGTALDLRLRWPEVMLAVRNP